MADAKRSLLVRALRAYAGLVVFNVRLPLIVLRYYLKFLRVLFVFGASAAAFALGVLALSNEAVMPFGASSAAFLISGGVFIFGLTGFGFLAVKPLAAPEGGPASEPLPARLWFRRTEAARAELIDERGTAFGYACYAADLRGHVRGLRLTALALTLSLFFAGVVVERLHDLGWRVGEGRGPETWLMVPFLLLAPAALGGYFAGSDSAFLSADEGGSRRWLTVWSDPKSSLWWQTFRVFDGSGREVGRVRRRRYYSPFGLLPPYASVRLELGGASAGTFRDASLWRAAAYRVTLRLADRACDRVLQPLIRRYLPGWVPVPTLERVVRVRTAMRWRDGSGERMRYVGRDPEGRMGGVEFPAATMGTDAALLGLAAAYLHDRACPGVVARLIDACG